jgi:hypothetical protein
MTHRRKVRTSLRDGIRNAHDFALPLLLAGLARCSRRVLIVALGSRLRGVSLQPQDKAAPALHLPHSS